MNLDAIAERNVVFATLKQLSEKGWGTDTESDLEFTESDSGSESLSEPRDYFCTTTR